MSLSFSEIYEFGDFRLDAREKILARRGEPLEIAPKAFELLSFFVENPGRLLSKDELMDKIWADSFVEESNLTFNIRQLRVILGDDAHDPKYIKTVRRHGYRFIADVRKTAPETVPQHLEKPASAAELNMDAPDGNRIAPVEENPSASPEAPKVGKFSRAVWIVCAVFLVVALGVGAWLARSLFGHGAPVLSAPFAAEKLSTNGKSKFLALSPDGKNLVYTNRATDEKEAIWLRRLDTGENVELIPPVEAYHYDLQISPDGATLYYSFVPWQEGAPSGIYRVSIAGGTPEKIADDIFGRVGISPDGKNVVYNRCPRRDDEYCALWISDADGKNERKLVSRAGGLYVGDGTFSPDGKKLAFTNGQSRNKANEFGIRTLDLETGAESDYTTEKFYVITSLAWLPDASGLLLTAFKFPDNNFRIWQVAEGGAATALTKVSEHYQFLSTDRAASKIAVIQVEENYRLRLFDLAKLLPDTQTLTDAVSAAFASSGKIYFSSTMSGNHEIWSINPDGANRRQLTNTKDEEYYPVVAPDGASVYFASTITGAAQVWRMKPDGTEHAQITQKAGGFPLAITKNGEWLYYLHGVDRTLWRVSLASGEEQIALNKRHWFGFGVSPDGALAAYPDKPGDANVLAVAEIPGGKIVKTFPLPEKDSALYQLGWTADGAGVLYVSYDRKSENFVLWKQPLNETAAQQITALGNWSVSGYNLPVSPDGTTFAAVQQQILSDVVLINGLR
jgi:Tol biopolymer transport system component/DNA-binding winged helix-turn-helix (wHTH) protein